MTRWLVTGGAGYIGGHVLRAFQAAGESVVVLDDLSSGELTRVTPGVCVVKASVLDADAVRATMADHRVDGVVHLAARKSVDESCADPLRYYQDNVTGLNRLLQAMTAEGVDRLVFSSSAAVYGTQPDGPVTEAAPLRPQSPYGRSKLVGEWMAQDAASAHGLRVVSLRYFNVVGCAEPALADHGGANLFPVILRRIELEEPVVVFGTDYPTPDGTCVRDYVHVQDLAEAHVAAAGLTARRGCQETVNVGYGRGHSVLEVVAEFGRAAGRHVPCLHSGRRPGDPAAVVADVSRAAQLLGWRARLGLPDMVASSWEAVFGSVPDGVGRAAAGCR